MSWRTDTANLMLRFVKPCLRVSQISSSGTKCRNYSRTARATISRNDPNATDDSNSTTTDSDSEKYSWESIQAGRPQPHIYKEICPWKSKEELADFLCANVVHESHGIIAINKPFGVGVLNTVIRGAVLRQKTINEGKPDPKKATTFSGLYHTRGLAVTHYTLEEVVPLLRERLGHPQLQLVKSPEKYASGIAIFGENEATAHKLLEAMRITKAQSLKPSGYLVVVTNIPKLVDGCKEERVGITLKQNEGTRMKQPVIEPNFSKASMEAGSVYAAHVKVKMLATNPRLGVACAEIKTDITKWNFLRVYSAFSLMPLLGDHLYSARVQSVMGVKICIPPLSIEPGTSNQKLSNEVLYALGVKRPEDSLIVPLHVHLHSLTLSKILSHKRQLTIKAEPPAHFEWTCDRLGLKPEE